MREKYNKDEKKIQQKYFSDSYLMPKDYIPNTAVRSSKPISARNQYDELEMTSEERDNFIKDKQNQSKQSNLHDSILSVFQAGTIQALADQKQTTRRRKKQLQDLEKAQKHLLENTEEMSSDVNVLQNQNAKLKKKLDKSQKQVKDLVSEVDSLQKQNAKLGKQLDKCKKQIKDLASATEESQKNLVLLCTYLGISERKTSFSELNSDLKCVCKEQRKKAKNN